MQLPLINRRVAGCLLTLMLWSVLGAGLVFTRVSFGETASETAPVEFDAKNIPRREILDRLLRGQTIQLEWRNSEIASEPITGTFKGTLGSIVRQLLAQTDFVIAHEGDAADPRISKVLILGRSNGSPFQQKLTEIERAFDATPIPGLRLSAPVPTVKQNMAPIYPVPSGDALDISRLPTPANVPYVSPPTATLPAGAAPGVPVFVPAAANLAGPVPQFGAGSGREK